MSTPAEVRVDSLSPIWALIYLSIVGGAAFIVQPAFVQAMVGYLHFSQEQAGYVASAEMSGFALTTIALVFVAERIDWRHAGAGLLGCVLFANAASLLTSEFAMFAACRFVAGLGGGGLVSLTFAALGMTSKAERNFGLMVSAASVFAAVVLVASPTVLQRAGMSGFIALLIGFALGGVPLLLHLPRGGEQSGSVNAGAVDLPWHLKLSAVGAMAAYFLAQGGVWAYLGLMGEAAGLGGQDIANALTAAQFTGILGALVAAIAGARTGLLPPLTLAVLCGVVPLIWLGVTEGSVVYWACVLVYNFGFNLAHPFLLSTMAAADRAGKLVVHAVACQTVGQALGPAIAASLVVGRVGPEVNVYGITGFLGCLLLVTPPCLAIGRARIVASKPPVKRHDGRASD